MKWIIFFQEPDEETSIQHRYLSHTANVIKLLGFYKLITYSQPVPLVRRGIRAQIQSHCSNRQSNRRGYSCGSIPDRCKDSNFLGDQQIEAVSRL